MKPRPLLLVFIVGLIIFFISLFILSLTQKKPVGGLTPDNDPDYKKSFEEIVKKDAEFNNLQDNIATLTTKLPYQGINFKLEYNISQNQYLLAFKKGQEEAGNQELDKFLQSYGVPDKDLLTNLVTISQ